MYAALIVILGIVGATIMLPAPIARADICPYPGVGVGVNVLVGQGGFCDYPTEINGSHMHCETGGFSLGGGFAFTDTGGFGGSVSPGISGASCSWRCPDGVKAPQPNPPGAWNQYLVVMDSTNFCKDHMVPNGFWSDPVLPTEGIPPINVEPPQPGEMPPPQPVPPALPTPDPDVPLLAPLPPEARTGAAAPMIDPQQRRGAAGFVAIILACAVGLALNLVTAAILYAAFIRVGYDPNAGISENGTQLLTGAFGGIIGALSSYLGYTVGKHDTGNGHDPVDKKKHAAPPEKDAEPPQ